MQVNGWGLRLLLRLLEASDGTTGSELPVCSRDSTTTLGRTTVKPSICIVAAIVGLAICAPAALADGSNADTTASSSPATQTPATEVPSSEVPATQVPATTEVPVTTEVPATTEPGTTTTVPDVSPTTTVPGTGLGDDIEACTVDCIPVADDCVNCIPSAGGGIPHAVAGAGVGALPFTGIEDTIAPLLLALVVVLGGVVAWRWAQLRESVAIDASRARRLPAQDLAQSGYGAAIRRNAIEQRARQMFTPRVA